MKKLTPEEKAERKREREEFSATQARNAPQWSMIAKVKDGGGIIDDKDSAWVLIDQGDTSLIQIEIRRPGTISGVLIAEIEIHMELEDWCRLADAALRRIRWIREQMGEYDQAVEDAMCRRIKPLAVQATAHSHTSDPPVE